MKRGSGILMPIASLPSEYGIGTFGKAAYDFVDMLNKSGQKYWQILPLGPTSYGDSPYQSFSTFAGNPYFIDLKMLIKEGLLSEKECDACDYGTKDDEIDYAKLYASRFKLLKKAFVAFSQNEKQSPDKGYKRFKAENEFWLDDYALFMAIKDSYNGLSYIEWDKAIRTREDDALLAYSIRYKDDAEFYKFLQYKFVEQWTALKGYANKKGILIVGDIPIYVAFDSADTWACPGLFQIDEKGFPVAVAGTPPDAFSETGQLWGNPLYNWKYHKKTGYWWWMARMKHCFKLYDIVRIDHFRGFDEYYSIPFKDETAVNGKWKKGPGYDLFKVMKKNFDEMPVIAEDLGYLTKSVLKLVKKTGFPGMKVLEFAFDSKGDSEYLPHNYTNNYVVYTGTHDNDTMLGWYKGLNDKTLKKANEYAGITSNMTDKEIVYSFIRLAQRSVADMCIIPMQDYLVLDNSARINVPSTIGGNWMWRMKKGDFSKELAKEILAMTKVYARK